MKPFCRSFAAMLLPLALLAGGCTVLADIDFQHIDKTVNVLKGLQVPVGGLETIRISDMLRLEDSEQFTVDAEGNYRFSMELDPEQFELEIPSLSIPAMAYDDSKVFNGHVVLPAGSWSVPALEVPGSYYYTFDWTWNGLPESIKSIRAVHIQPVPVQISFRIDGLPFSEVTLLKRSSTGVEFEILMPEWLHVVSCETPGFQLVDGNKLRLTEDCIFISGQSVAITVVVDGAENLTEADCTIADGAVSVRGRVDLKGVLSVREQKLTVQNPAPLSCSFFNTIDFGGTSLKDATVRLDADLGIGRDLEYKVGGLSGSEDLRFDLVFPDLSLDMTVTNGLPADVALKAGLRTEAAGGVAGHAYSVDETFTAGQTTRLCFNESGTGTESGVTYRKMERIGSILSPFPEKLLVSLDRIGIPEDWVTAEFGKTYALSFRAGIRTPFAFASGSELVITREIEDFKMPETGSVGIGQATLSFSVTNTLPLSFSIQAEPLDAQGRSLKGVATVSDASFAGGTLEHPATTPVSLVFQVDDLSAIASIRLTLSAFVDEATAGRPLNEKQGIKLSDFLLRLDSGLTATLDELTSQNGTK